MPIVTVSRGCFSKGKHVAEVVAERLGVRCLSRNVVLETSKYFKVPEESIAHALHDAPSFWEEINGRNQLFIAEFQALLLAEAVKDDFVYYGLGGQYLLREIDHVLKVRITADKETRIQEEMHRDNLLFEEAKARLERDDEQRRKWGIKFWGSDPWDSRLYDLVVHVGKLTCEDAAELIVKTVNLPNFKTTEEARGKVDNMAKAALIKARLLAKFSVGSVSCHNGNVEIALEEPMNERDRIEAEVAHIVQGVKGINDVTTHFVPFP